MTTPGLYLHVSNLSQVIRRTAFQHPTSCQGTAALSKSSAPAVQGQTNSANGTVKVHSLAWLNCKWWPCSSAISCVVLSCLYSFVYIYRIYIYLSTYHYLSLSIQSVHFHRKQWHFPFSISPESSTEAGISHRNV